MTVGLSRFSAVIALALFSLPITYAEPLPACPENSAQTASQIVQHYRTANPVDPKYVNVANSLQKVCTQDYVTNLGLAEAWASLSLRGGLDLQQRYETASRAMSLLIHIEALPSSKHNYDLAAEARKKTIHQLVAIADAGGQKISWLDGATPFPVCERGFSNPAQSLWYAYRKNQASAHTPILLEAQAKACMSGTMKDPLKYLAEYKIDLAERTNAPAQAYVYMTEARDLYDTYGGEDQSGLGWNPELRASFDRKYIKAGLKVMEAAGVMSKTDLFKAENMRLNRSKLDLQWYIDQSWGAIARDQNGKLVQDEVTARLRTHMYLLSDLAKLARAEGKAAEWYLYRALKDHSEGGLRTPAHTGTDNPPEFIRDIYNPSKSTD